MRPQPGQEADWIAGLSPEDFQRLALDLLRNHAEGVRPFDLPHGRTDGGFDGELVGSFGGLSGRVRVSVKGNKTFKDLKADALKDSKTHAGQPMLLVSRLRLDESQQRRLKEATGIQTEVIDGGMLASWLRDLHHLRASWWNEETALTPMSLRLAPWPEGRRSLGPWLRTECAALGALVQAVHEGKRLVLLATPPHTRGERCLWGLGRRLDRHPSGRAAWWLEAGRALPGDLVPKQREAVFFATPSSSEEEDLLDWAEGQWGRGHRCTLVLAVADFHLGEVQALYRGDPSEVGVVRLSRPADYGEVERLTRWLFDSAQVSDVTRRNFAYTWSHLPSLMEQGARRPELGVKRYSDIFDPDARSLLGRRALVAERPGLVELEQWADETSGLSRAARGKILTDAGRLGWLEVKTGFPNSSGSRWLMIHAWLVGDATALDGLLRSDPPDEALLGLAWAGRVDNIEQHLLLRLRSGGLRSALALLARLPFSTERLTGELIEAANEALEDLSPGEDRLLAEALERAARWPPLVPGAMSLALRLRERGIRDSLFSQGPSGILTWFTDPKRGISTLTALEGLGWIRDRLDELEPKIAIDAAAPWLRSAVERQEFGPGVMSFGPAGWKSDSPLVRDCWELAAEILTGLIRRRPMVEPAWEALRPIGTSPVDPQVQSPEAQVSIVRQLLHDALQSLPDTSDPYSRGLADSTLLVQVVHGPDRGFVDDALARAILAGLSRDPRVAAAVAGVATPRPIIDPDALLVAYEKGGARAVKHEYEALASDHVRLARRLVDARVDTDDLIALLTVIDGRIGPGWGPLLGMDLFRHWARLAPTVFEPVLLGDRWVEVPRDLQGPLLRQVAPIFGPRLRGRPNPQTLSPKRAGAALRIHRLLDRPDRVEADEAIRLLPALEELLEPHEVLGVMVRLAERPDPALWISLLGWLWRHLNMRRATVDPRDLQVLLARILVQPVSFAVLDALMLIPLHPEAPHRQLVLDAAVEAFKRVLEADDSSSELPSRPFEHPPLELLCTTLMTRSPALGVRLLARLPLSARRSVLKDLAREDIVAMLLACPDPLNARERIEIVDALAKRLPSYQIETLVRQSSPERGRLLLIASDAAEALRPLVDELAQGIESREERQRWLRKVQFGSLLFYKRSGPPQLAHETPGPPPSLLPVEEPDS